MSGYLWKHYLQDDVDSFRQLLESSSYVGRASASKAHGNQIVLGLGSPGSLGTGQNIAIKGRKREDYSTGTPGTALGNGATLTRADINRRDAFGRTLLHLAASSDSEHAFAFATALLEHSFMDIYVQDLESGWTALHRAFYAGNISIACAILNRDANDVLGPNASGFFTHSLGLIKVKDREGNGPLDLFTNTVDSDRHAMSAVHNTYADDSDEDEDRQTRMPQSDDDANGAKVNSFNLRGDEVFTFGSNQNVTLGFGDEDDRQYPERITLRRPDHLLRRFYVEHMESRAKISQGIDASVEDLAMSQSLLLQPTSHLPAIIRNKPIVIQDVYMAKLHTAVLTADPESNLYMCGHGQGGRLGTGDERTRYHFTCVEGGALAGKHVTTVALGQNHTLALSSEGDIFSWGNNGFGQLGYVLPKAPSSDEDPVQTLPRQIYGSLKREVITGVAASRIHSVAYTSTSLFTFGKNEGQLGIVDSDARSLESQATPRKVAGSMFSGNIASAAAIDRATVCLLETHEVYVFANYGYAKISFALDSFSSPFSQQSFTATRYETTPNQICKITAGGHTICAMSSAGEVFTITVNQSTEPSQNAGVSTTNPSKIRGALSQAHRIWDLRKGHMAARDVGVDQDGSIILTTDEGSVWRRVKRAKIKSTAPSGQYKAKDYKYSRIAGLTRAIAVRSSAFGAYAAIRRDCQVTRSQIEVSSPTLVNDMFGLLSIRELAEPLDDSDDENPTPRFWSKPGILDTLRARILGDRDHEAEVQRILDSQPPSDLSSDLWIKTTTSNVVLPLHRFILTGRSRVARVGLSEHKHSNEWSISGVLSIHKDNNGKDMIVLQGADFLTLLDLVLYLHTDMVVDFWLRARHFPQLDRRYRTIRLELLRLAAALELTELERSVRLQVLPKPTMSLDLELAFKDDLFLEDGDVAVQLADCDMLVHSTIVCRRCPFFEGLFMGRAAGRWLSDRADTRDESGRVQVNLRHVKSDVFAMVLRHIYADSGAELFDNIVTDSLDDFLDTIIEVMGVANELMLERLSQVCQEVVGKYVNVRNICTLLNAIAPCSVTEFKDKGLEYICLNLEALLAQGLLNELDEDLLFELDDVVRTVQLRCSEVTRSGVLEDALHEAHPELADLIEAEKLAKIDHMMLQARHFSADRTGSLVTDTSRGLHNSPGIKSPKLKGKMRESPSLTPKSPTLSKQKSVGDFMFEMDEDGDDVPALSLRRESTSRHHNRRPSGGLPPPSPNPDQDQWFDSRGKKLPSPSQSVSPSLHKTPIDSPAVTVTPQRVRPVDGSSPWGSSPLTSRIGMRDIMAQASSSRTSTLSMALSSQALDRPKIEPQNASSFQQKQSQKERKKSQQMQSKSAPDIPLVTAAAPLTAVKTGSPWQTVARPKVAVKEAAKASSRSASPSSAVVRNITAPPMTMRQTVAGISVSGKEKSPNPQSPQPDLKGHRSSPASGRPSATQPNITTSTGLTPQQNSSNMPKPQSPSTRAVSASAKPSIQSIRHIPKQQPEPLPGLSMNDILSQQQAEKIAIHDAATAKRSLQDIQQEQEFQQWWDLESRRVMIEEQQRASQASKAPRGSSRSKPRRGRGGAAGAASKREGQVMDAETTVTDHQPTSRPAGHGSDRGGRRGRSKGRGQTIGPSKQ